MSDQDDDELDGCDLDFSNGPPPTPDDDLPPVEDDQ